MFKLSTWVATVLRVLLLVCLVHAYETVEDAALIARKLVDLSPSSIGIMATVFPDSHPTLADRPFALQEYYASCHNNGSLTLVFLPISRHSRNILHSAGHLASISISSSHPDASRARVSLMGSVTVFTDVGNTPNMMAIKSCYLAKHPDAIQWLPGDDNSAHISYWARFDPQSVYFVGGFGDEHYIGEIPLHLYQEASVEAVTDLGKSQRVFSITGRVHLVSSS